MLNSSGIALVAPTVAFTFLGMLAVIARLVTRVNILRNAGADEVAIIGAMIFSVCLFIATIEEAVFGMGKRTSKISSTDLRNMLKSLWLSIIFYHASLTSTKISITLQYLRVFSGARMRIACWTVLAINAMYGISTILTSILTCRPVTVYWDKDLHGDCFAPWGFLYFFHPTFNIVTDLILITLPLPVLSSLGLPSKQKIGLILVFTLGGFVCIVSILRLCAVVFSIKSDDLSYSNTLVAMMSTIEVNTAIICASAFTIRPLLSRFFPRFASRSQTTTFTEEPHTRDGIHIGRITSEISDPGSRHGGSPDLEALDNGVRVVKESNIVVEDGRDLFITDHTGRVWKVENRSETYSARDHDESLSPPD